MAPHRKPPPPRRPKETHNAAGFGIPMAPPLGRNLFPGWAPVGGVFHRGFEAERGGGEHESDARGDRPRAYVATAVGDGLDELSHNLRDPYSGSMNGGGSFMDLMFDDSDQIGQNISSTQAEDQNDSPTAANASQARPTQKRSRNFSEEEDVLLVSAWLNVSLDAVNGADQSKSTYWDRITEYFHANKTFESNRT